MCHLNPLLVADVKTRHVPSGRTLCRNSYRLGSVQRTSISLALLRHAMSSLVMNTNAHMSMFLSESLGSSDPIGFSCEGTQSAPYFLRKQREQEIWQPIRSSPNCLADILEECLSLGALAPDPVLPWRDSEDSTLLSGSSSLEDIATTKAAVKALSADELNHVLSFLPVNSFTAAARVRKSWARSIRCTIQLNSTTAEKYFQHGLEIMKTTDSPWESLKLFRRATALNPRLIEAYFWEAKALFILNDWDGAVKTVERALEKQPSPVESLKLRACILYASNDDLRASQLLEVALPLAPNDASIHFELGFCYHGLEQFSKAIECYTTALELNYHRTFVLLANRANCLFRNNNIPEALQDLKVAVVEGSAVSAERVRTRDTALRLLLHSLFCTSKSYQNPFHIDLLGS